LHLTRELRIARGFAARFYLIPLHVNSGVRRTIGFTVIRGKLEFNEQDLNDRLLPLLVERVFHVTSRERCERILAAGAILPNVDGLLGDTYPQSANSLARHSGYVCLFDLRHVSSDALDWGLSCFYFLAPTPLGRELSFLIVSPAAATILHWDDVKENAGTNAYHVPEIEAWHDGPLPTTAVERILDVTVRPRAIDPNGLLYALMQPPPEGGPPAI
jgi:hypothetical protein